MKKTIIAGFSLVYILFSSLAAAEYEDQEERAQALLQRAVAYYQQEGERSFAAFSRLGRFTQPDLYVFVVDRKGVMVASGGPSRVLIGRPVTPLLDDQLKAGFESVLQAPKGQGVQQGEYRWMNWQAGHVERKKAFYQPVSDHIIAVGYYLPRAEKASAVNLLERTVAALEERPEQTIAQINQLDSQFYQDDLYPYVVDADEYIIVAHGYNPALVGTRFDSLRDHAGLPLGAEIKALMQSQDYGEFSYQWRNPVTRRVEPKTAMVQRIGRYLVAVGWYSGSEK